MRHPIVFCMNFKTYGLSESEILKTISFRAKHRGVKAKILNFKIFFKNQQRLRICYFREDQSKNLDFLKPFSSNYWIFKDFSWIVEAQNLDF